MFRLKLIRKDNTVRKCQYNFSWRYQKIHSKNSKVTQFSQMRRGILAYQPSSKRGARSQCRMICYDQNQQQLNWLKYTSRFEAKFFIFLFYSQLGPARLNWFCYCRLLVNQSQTIKFTIYIFKIGFKFKCKLMIFYDIFF